MDKVIGLTFKSRGKIYYFEPNGFILNKNEKVIVETAHGLEIATVMTEIMEITLEEDMLPLKPVLRKATEEDLNVSKKNREREREAFRTCVKLIKEHGLDELDMKLIDAEYTFDNTKIIFYFTSEQRIDFRELVKSLAGIYHLRIELRQIGVRDAAAMLGGLGPCGREVCCKSYMRDFNPVSIKMAKEQNLSLNPTKISGTCGRLMCCLANEYETYKELNKALPRVGAKVFIEGEERGSVTSINILRQRVKVLVTLDGDNKELREYRVEDITLEDGKKICSINEDAMPIDPNDKKEMSGFTREVIEKGEELEENIQILLENQENKCCCCNGGCSSIDIEEDIIEEEWSSNRPIKDYKNKNDRQGQNKKPIHEKRNNKSKNEKTEALNNDKKLKHKKGGFNHNNASHSRKHSNRNHKDSSRRENKNIRVKEEDI